VEEFVKEELQKELDGQPMYPGLTIEKLIEAAEFAEVRAHPNFLPMLERSDRPDLIALLNKQTGEATPNEEKGEPKPEAAAGGAPAPPAPPSRPQNALEIGGEEMDLPPMDPVVADDGPVAPKASPRFEAAFNVRSLDIVGPFSVKDEGALMLTDRSGLEDLLPRSSAIPSDTKSGKRANAFYRSVMGPGVIKPLKPSNGDGYVDDTQHALPSRNAVQNQPLKLNPMSVTPTFQATVQRILNAPGQINELIDPLDDGPAVALSLRELGTNNDDRALTQEVFMCPYRIYLLLGAIRAYKYLHMPLEDMLNPGRSPFLTQRMAAMLRTRNHTELDVVNDAELKLHLYEMFSIPGDFNRFYFDTAVSLGPTLYRNIFDRSYAAAATKYAHITSSDGMLEMVTRVSATVTNLLNRILPADAKIWATKLGALLSGGSQMELRVSMTDAATQEVNVLRPLGSMANLLVLDIALLPREEVISLIVGVLLPFMPQHDHSLLQRPPDADQNDRDAQFPRAFEKRGAMNLAIEIYDLGIAGRAIPANIIERSITTVLGGPRGGPVGATKRAIARAIADVLNIAMPERYGRIVQVERLFDFNMGRGETRPFSPWLADGQVAESVLFGTEQHFIGRYEPKIIALCNNLVAYSACLSNLQEIGNITPIIRNATKEPYKAAKGCAIMVEAAFRTYVEDQEAIPFNGVVNNPVDAVELPFLGALSFLLYGVGSSMETDSGAPFIEFKRTMSYAFPSKFAMYLYLEKAFANEVYMEFSVVDDGPGYHLTKPKLLVTLCLECLKKIFVSVDPDSERRLTTMFREWSRYLDGPEHVERVPAEFRIDLDAVIASPRLAGDDERGAVFLELDADSAPVAGSERDNVFSLDLQPYVEATAIEEGEITSVFIHVDAVDSVCYVNSKSQHVTITAPFETGATVLLDTLLEDTPYVYSEELSVDTIRRLAQKAGHQVVEVSSVSTKVRFQEQSGFDDEIMSEGKVTISRDPDVRGRKYKMTEVVIFYRRCTDENAIAVNGQRLAGSLNPLFSTYVSVPIRTLKKFLVNMDGYNHALPSLYDPTRKLRIMNGEGYVFTAPIKLATRESETVTIVKDLSFRAQF